MGNGTSAPAESGQPDESASSTTQKDNKPPEESGATSEDAAPKNRAQKRKPESKPKLLLSFDVNKTVVMVDNATGTTSRDLMCRVLAESCWGRIGEDKTWTLISKTPSAEAPEGVQLGNPADGLKSGDVTTYSDYLEHFLLKQSKDLSKEENSSIKKKRKHLKLTFAEEGQPGEALSGAVEQLCEKLLISADVKEACLASGIAALGGVDRFIIPAFFQTIIDLVQEDRDFWLCFRTFGHDHAQLIEEFNAFCNGDHPIYPAHKFNGEGGTRDLRIAEGSVGCFERRGEGADDTSLYIGVLTPEDKDQETESINGFAAIHQWFQQRMSQAGSFVLRDHYDYWASQAEDSFAGKIHLVDRANTALHSIFFDDNVEQTYAHIVDARDSQTGEKLDFASSVNCWYAKAQPLLAIQDQHYYTNGIRLCEQTRASAGEQ